MPASARASRNCNKHKLHASLVRNFSEWDGTRRKSPLFGQILLELRDAPT